MRPGQISAIVNEHTSEGGRDDRGVPYHAESTLSSAQVLKYLLVTGLHPARSAEEKIEKC